MGQYYLRVLLIMVVLAAFILPGYILRKKNMISQESLLSISNILLYVSTPFLFIKAFAVNPVEPTLDIIRNMAVIFAIAVVSMILTWLLCALLFCKSKDKSKTNIYTYVAIAGNCGFLGIPLMDMVSGGNTLAMIYVISFNVAFNLIAWTIGVYLMTQDKKDMNMKNAFINPSTIGCAIGLLLFCVPQINIFNMEAVAPLQQICTYLGNMAAPVSMIVVGARAADLQFKDIFVHGSDYVASILRLIISPAITLLLVLPFQLTGTLGNETYVYLSPVVASAMTPAAFVVVFSEKYGGNTPVATRTFISGTLLGIITIPIIITLVSMI